MIYGDSLMFQEAANSNGLKVLYNKDAIQGELKSGEFRVSYNGMGAAKTIESGKYMLMREKAYRPNTDRWIYGKWAYILPGVYVDTDTETEFIWNNAATQYAEFAVTSEAPVGEGLERLTFHGDPLLFDAYSGELFNESGTYIAPPYVSKATPALTGKIGIGSTQHMKIVYDEPLKLAEGA